MWRSLLLVAALACQPTSAVTLSANPIRKVVKLLQMMEKKVQEEGKQAEDLYEKFMCYCKKGNSGLAASIEAAEDKIPQLQSSLEQASASHQQITEELQGHKLTRTEAKSSIDSALSIREKEAAVFAEDSENAKSNIKALKKAIASLEKGTGGFLQTGATAVLQKLAVSSEMSESDRDLLTSFLGSLSGSNNSEGYTPQSEEIIGILKQMQEGMEKDLAVITKEEKKAIADHESLLEAKKAEVEAATKAVESKTARVGEIALQIANSKNDLEDTQETLEEDKKFLADLKASCSKKEEEWTLYSKTHGEELVAIADTIKILNDDDSLELFKKTLPGPAPSFLQLTASPKELRQQASQVLRNVQKDPRMDLLQLALRGQAPGFAPVLKMIDKMKALLQKEQKDDDSKKAYCQKKIDETEDELKAVTRKISDIKTVINEKQDGLQGINNEIAALQASIKELDEQVAEQTDLRKKLHEQTVQTLAENNAAKNLIDVAKNRLAKFYSPKLYKPAPQRVLEEDDQIVVNMGGTAPPTAAPGGIANTGITALTQERQEPQADLGYKKKADESGGVIAMLNMLQADLNKQITEMETQEAEAQKDYEAFMQDSSEKRALDAKSITDKEGMKASLEEELQADMTEERSAKADQRATQEELGSLHGECDWLLQQFDLRKTARAEEVDALSKAKAVLSGADFS
mmetsp:Transcript_1998/g.4508  ORF Transcript_1998/g.4508 Transcript_1998/m.4508 type:complete len:691 (+) Transcript_1998:62-2134(+)